MDYKELLTQYFQRPEIDKLIRQYVANKNLVYEQLTNDGIMEILEELQLMDDLLAAIQQQENGKQIKQLEFEQFELSNTLKNMKVYIERGRKFKGWQNGRPGDKFYISVAGFGQKGTTNSKAVSENFNIGEQFTFEVGSNMLSLENSKLLELSIVVMERSGNRYLYAIKLVEWRYVLAHGSISFDIELSQYSHQGTGPAPLAGILSLKLHLYPLSKLNMLQPTAIQRQIQFELKSREKVNNQFYTYANQFWNQYKQAHKSFQSRRIKLYGDSEDRIFIPLCRFVHPLYNVRGIDSPQHALRFCSLIPFEEQKVNMPPIHKRFHSMISGMQGNIDDHCHLLCSLLLGFGLKSYVCIGTNYKGDHSWVMSQDTKNGSIIFWQCTKSAKFDFFSPKIIDLYRNIHVAYNHEEFYANIQIDDSITGTKYKFKDNTQWKSLDKTFLTDVPLYNSQLALSTPTFDSAKIQQNLENTISSKIEEYRKNNKLSYQRDDILASILSTALANYEIQRVTGLTFCEDQFQSAIKNYIPPKHTFKAFPIQLTTLDPEVIMETLKNNTKCRQILLSKGDSVFFAIRTKLVTYPDNIFSLWLSIGLRYYKPY